MDHFGVQPVLEGLSKAISFRNPNAPLWPRLALGKEWDEVSRTSHILEIHV